MWQAGENVDHSFSACPVFSRPSGLTFQRKMQSPFVPMQDLMVQQFQLAEGYFLMGSNATR